MWRRRGGLLLGVFAPKCVCSTDIIFHDEDDVRARLRQKAHESFNFQGSICCFRAWQCFRGDDMCCCNILVASRDFLPNKLNMVFFFRGKICCWKRKKLHMKASSHVQCSAAVRPGKEVKVLGKKRKRKSYINKERNEKSVLHCPSCLKVGLKQAMQQKTGQEACQKWELSSMCGCLRHLKQLLLQFYTGLLSKLKVFAHVTNWKSIQTIKLSIYTV